MFLDRIRDTAEAAGLQTMRVEAPESRSLPAIVAPQLRLALITALHRTAQRTLPVMLVGAGLPQLRGRTGRARSYAERLFDFPEVGPLPPDAARVAISKPAADADVEFAEDALAELSGPVRIASQTSLAREPGREAAAAMVQAAATERFAAGADQRPGLHRSGVVSASSRRRASPRMVA